MTKNASLIVLMVFAPAISFADTTTISGVVKAAGQDGYEIVEATSGQTFEVDLNLHAGASVCGQVLRFDHEMSQALGRQTQLTGVFTTLSTGTTVFEADFDGIETLPD